MQHWLFITKKEHYRKLKTGIERTNWDCQKNTKTGDFGLLYRTEPKSDIAFVFKVLSDAVSNERRKYVCDIEILAKLKKPIKIAEMRKNKYLIDWSALKRNFQGSTFAIDEYIWKILKDMILKSDKNSIKIFKQIEKFQREKVIASRKAIIKRAKEAGLPLRF